MKKTYFGIGLMSGSSLDGLDVALCKFEGVAGPRGFELSDWQLLEAATLPFSASWSERLRRLPAAGAFDLVKAHAEFGHYLGTLVNDFFTDKKVCSSSVDFIASHGHTIFHNPAAGLTLQIGDGAALAASTGCQVVCDFRSSDIAHGGQGAPLAPMADKMLFRGYDFYLNIGGIANITCQNGEKFVAFDITGANQVLNAIAAELGLPYDAEGKLAASGQVLKPLLKLLNSLPYFSNPYPKSLSNQWVQDQLVAACRQYPAPAADRLRTACQHVAEKLADSIRQVITAENLQKERFRLLATGGGALNQFLMNCMRQQCGAALEIVVPDEYTVNFKEACLMALLGLMRLEGLPNCIASVTGARQDAIGGAVYARPTGAS
jgi:anhydro-N-acetylmuramic acid kinase